MSDVAVRSTLAPAALSGAACLLGILLAWPSAAQTADPAPVTSPTANPQAAGSSPAEPAASAPAAPRRDVEGAIGLLLHYDPAYPGASDYKLHANPAGFVRWGRFTLSGAGGFTTKRKDDVDRGLGVDLLRQPKLDIKLGLRFDNGRSESDSGRLSGLGDIRKTVRARLSARWEINDDWRAAAGVSVDALNRVGGYLVDVSVARQWRLAPDSLFTVSAGVSGAGDRYMQAWHGVTPEQSAASGLPVYRPSEGLRDMNISAVWRREFSPHWAGYLGVAGSKMLGPAADSPLTLKTSAFLASGALVWRF